MKVPAWRVPARFTCLRALQLSTSRPQVAEMSVAMRKLRLPADAVPSHGTMQSTLIHSGMATSPGCVGEFFTVRPSIQEAWTLICAHLDATAQIPRHGRTTPTSLQELRPVLHAISAENWSVNGLRRGLDVTATLNSWHLLRHDEVPQCPHLSDLRRPLLRKGLRRPKATRSRPSRRARRAACECHS